MESEASLKHSFFISTTLFLLFFAASPVVALSPRAIPAKAAIVMDAAGTVLYSKFPNAKLAPASTVKLVTAMVALDILKPEDGLTISANAGRTRTIAPRLCPDEEVTVSDLLHLALMKSINSAAVALAEAAAGSEGGFVVLMNQKAAEIGAGNTLFSNASGLPAGVQYTTASDLARIMQAALGYPLIRAILAKKEHIVRTAAGREMFLENSNDLLWDERNAIIGKTGYTGNARHCFVAAIDTERGPLYAAVLGARSRTGLWRSTQTLADIAMHPLPTGAIGRAGAGRVRNTLHLSGRGPASVGTIRTTGLADIQMSRLHEVFSQQTRNN